MTIQEKSDILYSEYFSIIQKVITRIAQNSFLIKAWLITIVATIIVLTFKITNILIFGVLVLLFWDGLTKMSFVLGYVLTNIFFKNDKKY